MGGSSSLPVIETNELLMTTSEPSNDCIDCPFAPAQKYMYRTYSARWLVLATCCFLALSNCMQWLAYNSVPLHTNVFYCDHNTTDCDAGIVTNQIFQVVAVVTGLGGMYITDHVGIRLSIFCGVTLNCIGSIVRLCSSHPVLATSYIRQFVLHLGSVIVAGAQAFFLVLPSKIAECWFPENQRALSNVLTFIANPGGVFIGTLLPVVFFPPESDPIQKDSMNFFYFNLVMSVVATFTLIMGMLIRKSKPLTPPSAANEKHADQAPEFFKAIFMCLKNTQFLVQQQTFALGFALLWAVMVIMPEILGEQGYALQGMQTAICAFVGIFSSLLAGHIADRTKRLKEILQFCTITFFLTTLMCRFYLETTRKCWFDDVVMFVAGALLGAASIPQFPIGVEIGVETTFPVYEATSSGLLVLTGQFWMFGLETLFQFLKKVRFLYDVKENGNNWRLCLDVWCILSFINACVCLLILRPEYNRIELEQKTLRERDETAPETGRSSL